MISSNATNLPDTVFYTLGIHEKQPLMNFVNSIPPSMQMEGDGAMCNSDVTNARHSCPVTLTWIITWNTKGIPPASMQMGEVGGGRGNDAAMCNCANFPASLQFHRVQLHIICADKGNRTTPTTAFTPSRKKMKIYQSGVFEIDRSCVW